MRVKLRMKKIYKSFLSLIFFLLLVSIGIFLLYSSYDKLFSPTSVDVSGDLSINYIDGKKIKLDKNAKLKYSITNTSSNANKFIFVFSKVRGNATYEIYSGEEVVGSGKLSSSSEIVSDYITIDANETKDYVIKVNTESLKTNLSIRSYLDNSTTFASIILNNNEVKDAPLTAFSEAATENEGLIKSQDDDGVSYYFRGNVLNNYVSIDNFLFRIVRINGDETVRLILDDVTDTVSVYYKDSIIKDYDNSEIRNYLQGWLNDNLGDYKEYIADTKFCSDVVVDASGTYNAYTRVMVNHIPTLNCVGTTINTDIGLLTIDEVIMAGAHPTKQNISYYLYNAVVDSYWYTMSGAKGDDKSFNLFMVSNTGAIASNINGNLYREVRPVINLNKHVQVTGDGTHDNPYTIVSNL